MGTVVNIDGYRRRFQTEQMKSNSDASESEVDAIASSVMDCLDDKLSSLGELDFKEMTYEEAQCMSLIHECVAAYLLKRRGMEHILHSIAEEIELQSDDANVVS